MCSVEVCQVLQCHRFSGLSSGKSTNLQLFFDRHHCVRTGKSSTTGLQLEYEVIGEDEQERMEVHFLSRNEFLDLTRLLESQEAESNG